MRLVERRHLRAGSGKLKGLAAGRRAKVEHFLAANVAKQARGQRGGNVLHPPSPVVVAWKIFDTPCAWGDRPSLLAGCGPRRDGEPHAPRRQNQAVELLGPFSGVAPHREIERRLGAQRSCDGGRPLAIGRAPAGEQPRRQVAARVERGEVDPPFHSYTPQYRVDQLGEAARAAIGIGQCDRFRHGRVRGGVENQKLGRSRAQESARELRRRRQRLGKETGEHCVNAAQPAQRR